MLVEDFMYKGSEKDLAYQKAWRIRNQEKIKNYRKDNKEKQKAYDKKRIYTSKSSSKRLEYRYYITLEEKTAMWEAQDRKCALRGCDLPVAHGRNSHLDHCHTTGKIRGVLCQPCNMLVGRYEKFKRDKDLIYLLDTYIKQEEDW